jgi:hypothetical protein
VKGRLLDPTLAGAGLIGILIVVIPFITRALPSIARLNSCQYVAIHDLLERPFHYHNQCLCTQALYLRDANGHSILSSDLGSIALASKATLPPSDHMPSAYVCGNFSVSTHGSLGFTRSSWTLELTDVTVRQPFP